jgi:hypothetical protein
MEKLKAVVYAVVTCLYILFAGIISLTFVFVAAIIIGLTYQNRPIELRPFLAVVIFGLLAMSNLAYFVYLSRQKISECSGYIVNYVVYPISQVLLGTIFGAVGLSLYILSYHPYVISPDIDQSYLLSITGNFVLFVWMAGVATIGTCSIGASIWQRIKDKE